MDALLAELCAERRWSEVMLVSGAVRNPPPPRLLLPVLATCEIPGAAAGAFGCGVNKSSELEVASPDAEAVSPKRQAMTIKRVDHGAAA